MKDGYSVKYFTCHQFCVLISQTETPSDRQVQSPEERPAVPFSKAGPHCSRVVSEENRTG